MIIILSCNIKDYISPGITLSPFSLKKGQFSSLTHYLVYLNYYHYLFLFLFLKCGSKYIFLVVGIVVFLLHSSN